MTQNKTDPKQNTRFYKNLQPILYNKKTAHYTPTILTFLAVSLFGWYAVRPTLQTIIYLRREIKDLEIVNSKMNDKINNLIEAQSNLETADPFIPAVMESLPNSPEVGRLLQALRIVTQTVDASISSVAVNSNPIISSQDPQFDMTKPLVLTPLSFSIIMEGNYDAIIKSIDELLALRRIIKINSFRLAPSTRRQEKALASVQLIVQLETYYSN